MRLPFAVFNVDFALLTRKLSLVAFLSMQRYLAQPVFPQALTLDDLKLTESQMFKGLGVEV